MSTKSIEECRRWYDENRAQMTTCVETLEQLLEKILDVEKITYQNISSRIKEKESFINKCKKEKYDNPIDEIMDVIGLRIIGYTNSDVRKICNAIEKEFEINKDESNNKAKILGEDQVGYLSIHYVMQMSKERVVLSEYKCCEPFCFEIQIRTLLQHAWAEIEHDKNYKFSGELPSKIKRRFYLVAGTLELVDREFESISTEIDAYSESVSGEISDSKLDIEVNSISLREYMLNKLPKIISGGMNSQGNIIREDIIKELNGFAINSIQDLDKCITPQIEAEIKRGGKRTIYGILRDVMMFSDVDKYFKKAYFEYWSGMDVEQYERYKKIIGEKFDEYVEQFNIDIE